jgi:hypothetical protein
MPTDDRLEATIFFAEDILENEVALRGVCDAIFALSSELRPETFSVDAGRKAKYAFAALWKEWQAKRGDSVSFLAKDRPELYFNISREQRGKRRLSTLESRLPLQRLANASIANELVGWFDQVARATEVSYGFSHPAFDRMLGVRDESRPPDDRPPEQAWWLNVLGPRMVQKIGVERVSSTPASTLRALAHGAYLVVTSSSPLEVTSEDARVEQTRVLTHWNPKLQQGTVLEDLLERSRRSAPVERDWDRDLEKLLEHTLLMVPLEQRRARERELNDYRPPPVNESRPAPEALPADLDEATADERYAGMSEDLFIFLHKQIKSDDRDQPEWLLELDRYFWSHASQVFRDPGKVDALLVPAIGAHLGKMLVEHLDGKWIPRRALDESQVLVGDRVYLPFLRARHFAHSKTSVLDHSLTKFFREAERHARNGPG